MIVVFLLLVVLIDFYVFNAINNLPLGHFQAGVFFAYWATVILTFLGIFLFFQNVRKGVSKLSPASNMLFGLAFSLIVAKIFYSIFLLGDDLFRLGNYALLSAISDEAILYPVRNSYLSITGILFSAVPFLGMSYGVIQGKYRYTTRQVQLKIKDLPDSFVGFKIAQFSDAHLGSFDSIKGLRKGIKALQSVQADVILFTGDMVNNVATEAEPYIDEFKILKAEHGRYSVLGNHDYGDYVRWRSAEEKTRNLDHLKSIQASMGFEMLHNRHVLIEKNGEQLCIAGVENWGKPPFPQFGDLDKAMQGVPENTPTVLMSHDPSHWDLQVKNYPKRIDLTLSGHTHGMQFGIDLPFFKWSPVKWRYPKWADLYEEAGRYLYVNRGFGFIGFPGRAGIWPEITAITLSKA